MKTKIFVLCVIGLVCAISAATLLAAPAHSRPLTSAEMSATVGRIGDGCPCTGLWEITCTDSNHYVDETTGNKYSICTNPAGESKTCHDQNPVECDIRYDCVSSDIVDDRRFDGYGMCTVVDTAYKCRNCEKGSVIDTSEPMDQTCTTP